ncbi:hypothetical protein [Actinokineospora globicatena]|uniref:hypothetical protein n=1 Tax=Actinokineospora globicatena TaxID=103729 RepID=UPI0020A5B9F8|nr:hypothetical protein [Actinokineospora globicatena]MCP2302755.1 hypothetical protein [Actinokineospora globicatena]GLW75555.1 hypothetical protein Aglo01_00370 [Actinokineospora globicatena]GLW82396.1 hypothetical protein Aglo02_00370 [Actinokineospora globicatena]
MSEELPPYLGVLVVDAERYGSNTDPGQQKLAEAIPEVLAVAFAESGLEQVWEQRLFPQDTGDGLGLGFDPRYLPVVAEQVLGALQEALVARDVWMRKVHRGLRLRLRAALHVGPIRHPGGGQALVTAHRLVDAAPLRDALKRSDADRTFLAALISDRVHDDVIATGYATVPTTPVPVEIKEHRSTAHLHVPTPTGDLLNSGLVPAPTADPADTPHLDPLTPGAVHNVMTGHHTGTAIQVGHLHGGFTNH